METKQGKMVTIVPVKGWFMKQFVAEWYCKTRRHCEERSNLAIT